jgi:hypothetical protein
MKKIFFPVLLTAVLLLLFLKPAIAWLDPSTPLRTGCPFGKINDPYPGSCFRYLDTNNNKICDYSEPAPTSQQSTGQPATSKQVNSFSFWLLFSTSSFYFIHWFLVAKTELSKKFKWLSQVNFRFFWHVILLISFLITGISGLILLFVEVNRTLVFWHNLAGLVFVIVAFFHFLNHLSYFKNLKNILK